MLKSFVQRNFDIFYCSCDFLETCLLVCVGGNALMEIINRMTMFPLFIYFSFLLTVAGRCRVVEIYFDRHK